jgi:Peptidase family M28
MRRFLGAGSVGLVLAACAVSPASRPAPPASRPPPTAVAAIDVAASTITPRRMYAHIDYLASDALRGRETPSLGLEAAATWVTESFRDIGLEPAGDDGSYTQRWPLKRAGFDLPKTAMRIEVGTWVTGLRVGVDFFVVPAVGMPSASSPLVYTGSGLRPRKGPGIDITSRFAMMVLPGVRPDSAWRKTIQRAMQSAVPAGATGLVMILDPGFDESSLSQAGASLGAAAPIFLIGMKRDIAMEILSHAGLSPDAAPGPGVPTDQDFGRLTISLVRSNEVDHPPNVVAVLRGSDPVLRDDYVVISSHMDHIGVGAPNAAGDSIYNGADDNASGVAAMIGVAEALSGMEEKPARSILFLATSGEELGLLGSVWFTDHPTVPADRMVANINLDMIGRNSPDSIVAIGQEYSSLGGLAYRVAREHRELHLTIASDPWPEEQLFFRSDHFNFARVGVPAIFFTSGVHADYHRPSDELRWIDTDKTARVARLVLYLANEIANAPSPPSWTEKGIADMKTVTGRN